MKRSPGILWIKAAVIYFIMGVGLGIYMGASGDHLLVPVHAHFNLLGWASLAVIGLVYQQFPVAGSHRLATVQFGYTTPVCSRRCCCWWVSCAATAHLTRCSASLPSSLARPSFCLPLTCFRIFESNLFAGRFGL